jgi:hypothetical protein
VRDDSGNPEHEVLLADLYEEPVWCLDREQGSTVPARGPS